MAARPGGELTEQNPAPALGDKGAVLRECFGRRGACIALGGALVYLGAFKRVATSGAVASWRHL